MCPFLWWWWCWQHALGNFDITVCVLKKTTPACIFRTVLENCICWIWWGGKGSGVGDCTLHGLAGCSAIGSNTSVSLTKYEGNLKDMGSYLLGNKTWSNLNFQRWAQSHLIYYTVASNYDWFLRLSRNQVLPQALENTNVKPVTRKIHICLCVM